MLRTSLLVGLVLTSLAGLAAPLAAQREPTLRGRARYEQCMRRLPLLMHYRGWEALSVVGDRAALQQLIADYANPKGPADQIRSNLVNLAIRHHRGQDNIELFERWRKRYQGAEHLWLWYRMFDSEIDMRDGDEALQLIRKAKDPWQRAAALHAYVDARPRDVFDLTEELLRLPPKKPIERAIVIEALAKGYLTLQRMVGDEQYDEGLRRLILQLDEKKTPQRSKLVLSRYLGRIFNSDRRSVVSDPWLRQMKIGRNKEAETEGYATTFFDIRAHGDRIAFVIDMSDSMLQKVPKQFVESKRSTGRKPKKAGRDYNPFVDEYEIYWHEVETRFDLAREHIKRSLYSMPEDKFFSIIGFGDEARLMDGVSGMVKANKRNIARAVKALDAIRPGSPNSERPFGKLWGKTNLYGGIHRAFQVTKRGTLERNEATSPKTLFDGADVMFVLSDGRPTWDDWHKVDIDYEEDRVGDPETGRSSQRAENMHYSGPYRDWGLILEDVRRLNLVRNVEIHCVGIGEAEFSQLDRLAKLGLGQSRKYSF